MSNIEVFHPDHPKVYARWTVVFGGGKSPIKWAMKPPTTRKSTAKLSHIAKVQARLEPALALAGFFAVTYAQLRRRFTRKNSSFLKQSNKNKLLRLKLGLRVQPELVLA